MIRKPFSFFIHTVGSLSSFCWFDHKIDRWEFSSDPGVEGEPGKPFFFPVIFFRFSWFNMNSSWLSVDRRWSHAHPAGESPRPVKPKICCVHRDGFLHAEVGLVTLKSFLDKNIYWRLLGILSEFPPKKTLSWILDERKIERERERERLVFWSFISHVLIALSNSDAKVSRL